MRVRLTTDRVDAFGAFAEGDVIEVPDDEGERLIASGQAVTPVYADDDDGSETDTSVKTTTPKTRKPNKRKGK